MKKRILSLLLVLTLLVTVSVFAVEATEPATQSTKDSFAAYVAENGETDIVKAYCEACQEEVEWQKSSATALKAKSGHVYIPSTGTTVSSQQVIGYNTSKETKFCLFMNGDLTRNIEGQSSNAYLFRLFTSNTDAPAGKIIIFNVMGNGTAVMSATGKPASGGAADGAVINTSTMKTAGGDGVLAAGTHTVNIYDGVIIDGSQVDLRNKTTRGGAALAIANACGTINMYGGIVKGGTATHGGAVRISVGTFNMYGGTIEGGTTTSSSSSYGGGAIFMTGAATFNMYKGAKITGGTSKFYGGSVRLYGTNAEFNMYGGIIENGLCNGSKGTYKRGGNVAVSSSGFFNMYGGTIQNVTDKETAWAGGNIYSEGTFTVDEDAEVTLPAEAVKAGAQREAEAKIIGGKADRGGNVTTTGTKPFTLKSGTIEGGVSDKTGASVHNEGNFILEGGVINGGTATEEGGAVYVGNRTFTMTGGTINGGTAARGGAVAVYLSGISDGGVGTFNMEGGTINGGQVTGGGAAVFVSADVYEAKITEEKTETVEGVETTVEVLTGITQVGKSGVFNMTGGTINGGTEENPGAADSGVVAIGSEAYFVKTFQEVEGVGTIVTGTDVEYVRGVFNLNGDSAVINGTNATISNRGGTVYIYGGEFNQTLGTINGIALTDASGAAVYMSGNTAERENAAGTVEDISIKSFYNMNGGLIQGGSVQASTKSVYGGNVYVSGNSEFTMNDGIISGGKVQGVKGCNSYGGNVAVYGIAKFVMNGGTIKDGHGNGTAVYHRGGNVGVTGGGTFVMNDGTIKDGYSTWIGPNVAMNNSSSTFTMKGGEISGGSKFSHGPVALLGSTFNLEGGTITGATKENKATGGGAVLCEGKFNMTGGTIQDGHATDGGNVLVGGGGKFTMDGGVIQNGSATADGGNIAVTVGKNSSGVVGTLVLNKGQILNGTAATFGGNIAAEGHKTSDGTIKRSTVTMTEANEGDLLIAAGVNTKNASGGYGGNLYIGNYTDVTINSGMITTEYNDGTTQYTGKAYNGVNIGIYGYDNTLTLNGGKIVGAIESSRDSIAVGSRDNCAVTLGNAILHDERSEGADIHFTGVLNNTAGEGEIGLLTVTDAFTGNLKLSIGKYANAIVDNAINTLNAVAQGYTGDKIVLSHDGVRYPIVGDGEKLLIAEAALVQGDQILDGGSFDEMVAAYAANAVDTSNVTYVKLFNAEGKTFAVGGELNNGLIDLNGNNVTLNNSVLFGLMDSATNDYDDSDVGSAQVLHPEAVTGSDVHMIVNGNHGMRRYALIENEDGSYSAHRFYITMRNVGLRVDEDTVPDLIYSGSFRGTKTISENVESFGIIFRDENFNELKRVKYNENGQAFTAGNIIYGKNVCLNYSEDSLLVNNLGEATIIGEAYIKIAGDEFDYICMANQNTSLRGQVESFTASYDELDDGEKAIYDTMIAQAGTIFNTLGWTIKQAA